MINIIVAVAENNVIGRDNQLIWHIPDDLKRFKRITLGHPMIMGRKTFASFGNKPLPKRHHIVISREDHDNTEQVTWVKSINEAIELATSMDDEIYIIGGGNIYKQTIDLADKLEITRIHKSFDGDTFFPEIPEEFTCIQDEKHWKEDVDFAFSYRTYVRKNDENREK